MKFSELKLGCSIPGDCGRPSNERPEWMDVEMLRRAQSFFKDNYYSIMFGHSCGPFIMGQVPSLAIPVLMTGRTDTVPLACKRMSSTVKHVMAWYEGDVFEQDQTAHQSIQQIRRVHQQIIQMMNLKQPSTKDHVWLSQYDMALTQFAFMGAIVLSPENLGLQGDVRDIECLLHFWRFVGYLLGMEDRFNICSGNYQETLNLFQSIVDHVVFPSLANPREEFQKLTYNGVAAVKAHSLAIDFNAFMNISSDITGFQNRKHLGWSSSVYYWIHYTVVYLVHSHWMRALINFVARFELERNSKKYLNAHGKGSGFVQQVQDILFGEKNTHKKH